MPYPENKETFRRVVNQLLPEVRGDVVRDEDQNLPADFLERLQDTLGYNFKSGYESLAERIQKIENGVPYKNHRLHGPYKVELTNGAFSYFDFGAGTPITPGNIVIARISGAIVTNVAGGNARMNLNYKIDATPWTGLGEPTYIDNFKQSEYCGFSYTTEKIDISSGSIIQFRTFSEPGAGSGWITGLVYDIYVI